MRKYVRSQYSGCKCSMDNTHTSLKQELFIQLKCVQVENKEFAEEFVTEAFREDNEGWAIYCCAIVHEAAKGNDCQAFYCCAIAHEGAKGKEGWAIYCVVLQSMKQLKVMRAGLFSVVA